MKLNRAHTQSLKESLDIILIKLLASLGYSVFKFSWIHTTQVDKNAVKVIGYYKLNKA